MIRRPGPRKTWRHPRVRLRSPAAQTTATPSYSPAAKAAGEDAPKPVRALLAARPETVVLRWRPELGSRFLRRYFADGTNQDPAIGLSKFGTGKGRADPLRRHHRRTGDNVHVVSAVRIGHPARRWPYPPRFPRGQGFCNYVEAMLSGWADADIDVQTALMWTVDHGGSDITTEMRAVIANPLAAALTPPPLARLDHLTRQPGHRRGPAERACLPPRAPGLLVTSSHGRTSSTMPPRCALRSGFPSTRITPRCRPPTWTLGYHTELVWYAHACCSGRRRRSEPLRRTAPRGGQPPSAPSQPSRRSAGQSLPAPAETAGPPEHPIRAVYGHVEPTFNWTLRVLETGQGLGHHIVAALSSNLYHQQPVGLTFADYRAGVGELHDPWPNSRKI